MHFNTLNVKIYSLDIQFYDFFYFYDFINCQFTGFQPVCKCKKKLKSETKQRIYILIPLTVSISVVLFLFKWRKLLKTFWILKHWIYHNIRFPSINFYDIFKDIACYRLHHDDRMLISQLLDFNIPGGSTEL